jgi:hypothetical protein
MTASGTSESVLHVSQDRVDLIKLFLDCPGGVHPDGLAYFGDDLPCRDTHVDSVDNFNCDATEVRDQVPVVIPEHSRLMSGLPQQRKVLTFSYLGVDPSTPVSLAMAFLYALVDFAED